MAQQKYAYQIRTRHANEKGNVWHVEVESLSCSSEALETLEKLHKKYPSRDFQIVRRKVGPWEPFRKVSGKGGKVIPGDKEPAVVVHKRKNANCIAV